MNFERDKNRVQEKIGLGREVFLIKQITEYLKKSVFYKNFEFVDPYHPNNPEIVADWVDHGTGSYFYLIKTKEIDGFTKGSKYPDYYLLYDLGLYYGRNKVDKFLRK